MKPERISTGSDGSNPLPIRRPNSVSCSVVATWIGSVNSAALATIAVARRKRKGIRSL